MTTTMTTGAGVMARERTWDPSVPAPAWFVRALAAPQDQGRVVVEGAEVRYLAWGAPGDPTLVLVHGGAAHAQWWAPLAPLLADDGLRVIALDLTGHGDSDRREVYSVNTWAEEVLAVAADAGGSGRPVVVGHSMGGFVTIATAAVHGAELDGVVVIDAPVRRPDPETMEGVAGGMFRAPKVYPDLEEGMRHFHLVPPQPCENGWLVAHVARHSLHEVEGGVTWKFDPGVFTRRAGADRPSDFGPLLARAACRVAIVNGAGSAIVSEDTRAYMAELLADSPAAVAGVPFVEIPEAQHHVLLDQPLALVTALRAVFGTWHPVGTPPAPVPVPPR
jgi:pimeloyl-ACP methyl ester carboxylesterase